MNGLLIVFLYNYAVNILCIKTGDGYGFYCLLKQVEIDVQSTSNRKLPNFYEKVTEFLNDDKILWLQRLGVYVRIGLYRRAEQTVYLYVWIGYLCNYEYSQALM